MSPGLKKSNCGGWQSERNLQLWGGPAIDRLLERVHTMLHEVLRTTVYHPDESLLTGWDVEAWANVNQLGDTVAAHTHTGGVNMWAAIYYVDTGESAGAPGLRPEYDAHYYAAFIRDPDGNKIEALTFTAA